MKVNSITCYNNRVWNKVTGIKDASVKPCNSCLVHRYSFITIDAELSL